MKKIRYKKILIALLLTGVLTNTTNSFHYFAMEKKENESSLGPSGLQKQLAKTSSSILVMSSYAKGIRNQPVTDLSNIHAPALDTAGVRNNIIQHQNTAKQNAIDWQQNVKSRIIQTDQNIIDFNYIFQAYYERLSLAITQQNKEQLKTDLEKLYECISHNRQEADVLTDKIQNFRTNITEDSRHFKEDFNLLAPILASADAEIPAIQQQLKYWNDEINRWNNQIRTGQILCLSIIGCIAGGPMIIEAKIKISAAETEIEKLKESKSRAEREVLILTDFQNKTTNAAELIDSAVDALQFISNQWYVIQTKYETILNDVQNMNPEELSLIQLDLNIAKKDWQDLKNYAEQLHKMYLTTC